LAHESDPKKEFFKGTLKRKWREIAGLWIHYYDFVFLLPLSISKTGK